uniref:Uncharacterized protein n=1 Tax=Nelumbo nucifera TaxID=4432 RepID=A0A822Y7P4_NELNU|nr:TPA_asm: hypothetical protein HUJ06_029988 [Nelumbo nucifera]
MSLTKQSLLYIKIIPLQSILATGKSSMASFSDHAVSYLLNYTPLLFVTMKGTVLYDYTRVFLLSCNSRNKWMPYFVMAPC